MKKDVILKINGLHLMDGDSDTTETISPGQYYFKNGRHYFVYEEVTEGFEETTKNRIKISDGYMELYKQGVTNVHMVFEKGKKNVTYYYTPFGSLLIGIDATRVDLEESEDRMQINVEYALEINNEFVADCKISIVASSEGTLSLS